MKPKRQSIFDVLCLLSFSCCAMSTAAPEKLGPHRQLLARQLENLDLSSILALLSPTSSLSKKPSTTTKKPGSSSGSPMTEMLSPDGLTAVIECEISDNQGLCVPANMTHFVCAPLGFTAVPHNRTCGSESLCCYMMDGDANVDVSPPSSAESKASLSKTSVSIVSMKRLTTTTTTSAPATDPPVLHRRRKPALNSANLQLCTINGSEGVCIKRYMAFDVCISAGYELGDGGCTNNNVCCWTGKPNSQAKLQTTTNLPKTPSSTTDPMNEIFALFPQLLPQSTTGVTTLTTVTTTAAPPTADNFLPVSSQITITSMLPPSSGGSGNGKSVQNLSVSTTAISADASPVKSLPTCHVGSAATKGLCVRVDVAELVCPSLGFQIASSAQTFVGCTASDQVCCYKLAATTTAPSTTASSLQPQTATPPSITPSTLTSSTSQQQALFTSQFGPFQFSVSAPGNTAAHVGKLLSDMNTQAIGTSDRVNSLAVQTQNTASLRACATADHRFLGICVPSGIALIVCPIFGRRVLWSGCSNAPDSLATAPTELCCLDPWSGFDSLNNKQSSLAAMDNSPAAATLQSSEAPANGQRPLTVDNLGQRLNLPSNPVKHVQRKKETLIDTSGIDIKQLIGVALQQEKPLLQNANAEQPAANSEAFLQRTKPITTTFADSANAIDDSSKGVNYDKNFFAQLIAADPSNILAEFQQAAMPPSGATKSAMAKPFTPTLDDTSRKQQQQQKFLSQLEALQTAATNRPRDMFEDASVIVPETVPTTKQYITTAAVTTSAPVSSENKASLQIKDYEKCGKKGSAGEGQARRYDGEDEAERQNRQSRLIGGRPTNIGEYCWHAVLLDSTGQPFCSGVIIDRQWVLTAAQCIQTYAQTDIRVRVGAWTLNTTLMYERGVPPAFDHFVLTSVVHFGYNALTSENNVALLKLNPPVRISKETPHICAVCLPSVSDYIGKSCYVTGFAATPFPSTSARARSKRGIEDAADSAVILHDVTNVLQEIPMPIVPDRLCETQLLGTGHLRADFQLNRSVFFCAGGLRGRDVCGVDSGGTGLVCDVNGRYEVAGLVSWGVGCGIANVPGVYAKVSSYAEWIGRMLQRYS